MSPVEKPSDIPPAEMADMVEVCRLIAEGKPRHQSRAAATNPRAVRASAFVRCSRSTG